MTKGETDRMPMHPSDPREVSWTELLQTQFDLPGWDVWTLEQMLDRLERP
ncbi:MAG: hypothetical protein AAFR34_03800 [Pseudomonadota bacterium]